MGAQDSERQVSVYYLYYYNPETQHLSYQKHLKLSDDLQSIVRKKPNSKAQINPPLEAMSRENVVMVRVTSHFHQSQDTQKKTTEIFCGK